MSTSIDALSVTEQLLREWPLPSASGSKYERGQVLVIGGSTSSPGAVMLAGIAALRVGAGRLTFAVAASLARPIAVAIPESGVLSLDETEDGHVDSTALQGRDEFERADAVLLGPGISDPEQARLLIDAVVPMLSDRAVVVLDAFALGVLEQTQVSDTVRGRLILTPNDEEAEILLGRPMDDRDAGVREIAAKYAAATSCFGTVASAQGGAWSVDLRSEGLGTSGSGDVLAGILTGLAARCADVDQAAVWGTYLHMRAGQIAGDPPGRIGYLARELADALPQALALTQ